MNEIYFSAIYIRRYNKSNEMIEVNEWARIYALIDDIVGGKRMNGAYKAQ